MPEIMKLVTLETTQMLALGLICATIIITITQTEVVNVQMQVQTMAQLIYSLLSGMHYEVEDRSVEMEIVTTKMTVNRRLAENLRKMVEVHFLKEALLEACSV